MDYINCKMQIEKCKMQMIELGFGHWDLTDLVSCFAQPSPGKSNLLLCPNCSKKEKADDPGRPGLVEDLL